MFDLVSARHTIIDAEQIYKCLNKNGTLVIEGIDKMDCFDLKQMFGRGQSYNDKIPLSKREYDDIKKAGFSKIEQFEILENEYYETKEDLMALLFKTPILNDFCDSKSVIEKDLFDKYVNKYKTENGILLKRVLYGIIVKK